MVTTCTNLAVSGSQTKLNLAALPLEIHLNIAQQTEDLCDATAYLEAISSIDIFRRSGHVYQSLRSSSLWYRTVSAAYARCGPPDNNRRAHQAQKMLQNTFFDLGAKAFLYCVLPLTGTLIAGCWTGGPVRAAATAVPADSLSRELLWRHAKGTALSTAVLFSPLAAGFFLSRALIYFNRARGAYQAASFLHDGCARLLPAKQANNLLRDARRENQLAVLSLAAIGACLGVALGGAWLSSMLLASTVKSLMGVQISQCGAAVLYGALIAACSVSEGAWRGWRPATLRAAWRTMVTKPGQSIQEEAGRNYINQCHSAMQEAGFASSH